MKIMNEYTYHQIKKNKRHTISILVAIMIASALLFSMCIFVYSYWQAKVDETIRLGGNWHGELFEAIKGDKLVTLEENKDVESIMVKGNWYTAKVPTSKRPYLLLRDGNAEFWQDMNLKNTVMEGRVPSKENEVVIAKQFFIDNPDYKVGDTFTVSIGNRMLGDKELETRAYKQDNETFKEKDTKEYTIVGELDISGASAYPGYIAMGYLNKETILPTDELTVYVRLTNPQNIYQILPKLAKDAGLKQDSKGQYEIKYNADLLGLYGISDKSQMNVQMLTLISMCIIILLLVMGTFVLIIYNAFSMSASSRMKELSILKSLGATPKQIKYSVLYEGFLLWLLQAPFGILVGLAFSQLIFKNINKILSKTQYYTEMKLSFSWIVVLFAMLISLLTVLLSAYIPAKKMAKVPAVEGIQSILIKKKLKDHRILCKLFGMEGELAGRQFAVNRKSLKTAILSLALCITLVVSYLSIISIYNVAEAKDDEVITYDMTVELKTLEDIDEKMLQNMCQLPQIKESVKYRQAGMKTYVTSEDESETFAKAGGFDSVDMKYSLEKVKDKYKMNVQLVGLENKDFDAYCKKVGVNSSDFYDMSKVSGILYDNTYHTLPDSNDMKKMTMLKWVENKPMHLYEKIDDTEEGAYEFDIAVKKVTNIEAGAVNIGRYCVAMIVPMQIYNQLTANFSSDRELEVKRMTIDFMVGDENSVFVKKKLDEICSQYFGKDDYSIWSLLEEKEDALIRQKAVAVAVYAVALMFGIIGLFNACSTITNNLIMHKRDYAMLRSIGLTPEGLNKMLLLEGCLFVFSPIIISVPCVFLICQFMLNMTAISRKEYMGICPVGSMVLYLGIMVFVIFMAYICSSKIVKTGNVIEAIQNEIV